MPVGKLGLRYRIVGGAVDPCMSRGITLPTIPIAYNANILAAYTSEAFTGGTDNTSISSWVDNSGNGNTATQGTSSKKPTLSFVSGVPTVFFDSVFKTLAIAGLAGQSSAAGWTFHLAIRGDLTNQGFKAAAAAQAVGGGFAIEPDDGTPLIDQELLSISAASCQFPGTCKWHVLSAVARVAGAIELWRNGVLVASAVGVENANPFTVWSIGIDGGISWVGRFVEYRIYNAEQSSATMASEATAIKTRWGFQ